MKASRSSRGDIFGRAFAEDLSHLKDKLAPFDSDVARAEVAQELERTLTLPDLTPASAFDIRYQLALAFEVGGRLDEALEQFEKVYASEPNYPDVASKIRGLRKMLEQD